MFAKNPPPPPKPNSQFRHWALSRMLMSATLFIIGADEEEMIERYMSDFKIKKEYYSLFFDTIY